MTNKTKLIAGVLGASAITFFAYKFYQTYKQLKEDEVLAKAPSEVDEQDTEEDELPYIPVEEMTGEPPMEYYEEIDDDLDDDSEEYTAMIFGEEVHDKLRFEPDTLEAYEQYISMRLSDLQIYNTPENVQAYNIMIDLFNVPFVPINAQDRIVLDNIMEQRINFFGDDKPCKWNSEGTFAEVILHFAELASADLTRPVTDYIKEFLSNCGMLPNGIGSWNIDNAKSVMMHLYSKSDTSYGMFGLLPLPEFDRDPSFWAHYNAWVSIELGVD